SERRAAGGLIVELAHVTRLDALELGFHIDAVVRSDLFFDASPEIEPIDVIVWPLALVEQVIGVEGIAEVAERAVLRAGLVPVAPAEILRAGKDSQPVPLEQL